MTNVWIDCEFNELGGDLISMAMVADSGEEFYEVVNLPYDKHYGPWVSQNVIPVLNKAPIDKHEFRRRLKEYLNQWDEVNIIADWPDDIKYFCQSLISGPGTTIAMPLKLTMRLDMELDTKSSRIPHNALEDARAIRRSWYRIKQELDGYGVTE